MIERFFAKLRLLKLPFYKKPKKYYGVFILFLLFAGIFAITQVTGDSSGANDYIPQDVFPEDILSGFGDEDGGKEYLPEWIPPGPPRWFRSNAGGMSLEEIPSRLAALRSRYALVIDYLPPNELEPRLAPFYRDGYTIEIRVLYEQRKESRRQWLFRDEKGNTRLNAVFISRDDKTPDALSEDAFNESLDETDDETDIGIEGEFDEFIEEEFIEFDLAAEDTSSGVLSAAVPGDTLSDDTLSNDTQSNDTLSGDIPLGDTLSGGDALNDFLDDTAVEEESAAAFEPVKEGPARVGFIEIYNEQTFIIEDYVLFEDDSEMLTTYFYNRNLLIKTQTREKVPAGQYRALYTDNYRYNRSYSLRHVERLYHTDASGQPIRLMFPGRVLDAASDASFFSDKLALSSDFIGNFSAGEGYRVVYATDSRGRILTQTMFDDNDKTVWVIKNTWVGDRIVSVLKTEGDDEKLTEYEYDGKGNRIVQRDINNGVLERRVFTEGDKETEELFMNGIVVLRAYWENGRKISEERIRR